MPIPTSPEVSIWKNSSLPSLIVSLALPPALASSASMDQRVLLPKESLPVPDTPPELSSITLPSDATDSLSSPFVTSEIVSLPENPMVVLGSPVCLMELAIDTKSVASKLEAETIPDDTLIPLLSTKIPFLAVITPTESILVTSS